MPHLPLRYPAYDTLFTLIDDHRGWRSAEGTFGLALSQEAHVAAHAFQRERVAYVLSGDCLLSVHLLTGHSSHRYHL